MLKLDISQYKRLQQVSSDFFDIKSDYYLSNIYEDRFTGPNRIKLLINILVEEGPKKVGFWNTYAKATIASSKVNLPLSIVEIQKLLKLSADKYKESKKKEDLELLNNLSEFISSNRLLSEACEEIETGIYPSGYGFHENPSQVLLDKIITEGKEVLFKSILVHYGVLSPNFTAYYTRQGDLPEKAVVNYLQKRGLITGDYGYDLKAVDTDSDRKLHDYDVFLARGMYHYYIEGKLAEFKNRINYVRVSHGQFVDNFVAIWNHSDLEQGDLILEKVNDAISFLQTSILTRQNFFMLNPVSAEELSILGGLSNPKTITNEISSGKSLLKKERGKSDLLTYKSCMNWLEDSKRRKANFYGFLDKPIDVSLEDLKEIYES